MQRQFIEIVDEEDGIDGCDVDFTIEEQTKDADLPEASGGVGSAEDELDGFFADLKKGKISGCNVTGTVSGGTSIGGISGSNHKAVLPGDPDGILINCTVFI